jgi:hypothetical protein
MCQISRLSVYNNNAITTVQTAAPESLNIIAVRRSHRSTSAPAKGAIIKCGRVLKSATSASGVTAPVSMNTHTPSANPVSPDPIKETNCPVQMTTKVRILFAETSCTISSPVYFVTSSCNFLH